MVTNENLRKFKEYGFVHFKEVFSKELCNETRLETKNYIDSFISDNSKTNKSDFEFIDKKQKVKYQCRVSKIERVFLK